LQLPPIDDADRKTEGEFWAAFEKARPRILGALLDAVAVGLASLPHTHIERPPRMADFTLWVTACEPALGWPHGLFLATYPAPLGATNEMALESSLVCAPLRDLLVSQGGTWTGTASTLLKLLEGIAGGEGVTKREGWPTQPHRLSGHLRRLAPSL